MAAKAGAPGGLFGTGCSDASRLLQLAAAQPKATTARRGVAQWWLSPGVYFGRGDSEEVSGGDLGKAGGENGGVAGPSRKLARV